MKPPSGHAAAPPSSDMNSRRVMDFPEVQNSPTTASNAAVTAGITAQRNRVNGSSCTAAILRRRCLTWVKSGKTQIEQMLSALRAIADIGRAFLNVRVVPNLDIPHRSYALLLDHPVGAGQ
jgi:hypothetical protein